MKQIEKIRQAMADYMWSEGCSCCRSDSHEENKKRLAKLLKVPRYRDRSGFNFTKFKSKKPVKSDD